MSNPITNHLYRQDAAVYAARLQNRNPYSQNTEAEPAAPANQDTLDLDAVMLTISKEAEYLYGMSRRPEMLEVKAFSPEWEEACAQLSEKLKSGEVKLESPRFIKGSAAEGAAKVISDLANKIKAGNDYFSDSAIYQRIADWGVTDSGEIETLYNEQKRIGRDAAAEAENWLQEQIDYYSGLLAYRAEYTIGGKGSFAPARLDGSENLQNTGWKDAFAELLRTGIDYAVDLLEKGFSGNLYDEMEKFSLNQTGVRFEMDGASLTLGDLDAFQRFFDSAPFMKTLTPTDPSLVTYVTPPEINIKPGNATAFNTQEELNQLLEIDSSLLNPAKKTASSLSSREAADKFLQMYTERLSTSPAFTQTPVKTAASDRQMMLLNEFTQLLEQFFKEQ